MVTCGRVSPLLALVASDQGEWACTHVCVFSTRLRAGCSRADCLRLFCYLCSAGLLPVTPPIHHTPSHTRHAEFLAIPCDVLVPAALGGVINSRIAPKLQCKVLVCSSVCFVCDRCLQRWAACVINSRIAPKLQCKVCS